MDIAWPVGIPKKKKPRPSWVALRQAVDHTAPSLLPRFDPSQSGLLAQWPASARGLRALPKPLDPKGRPRPAVRFADRDETLGPDTSFRSEAPDRNGPKCGGPVKCVGGNMAVKGVHCRPWELVEELQGEHRHRSL